MATQQKPRIGEEGARKIGLGESEVGSERGGTEWR